MNKEEGLKNLTPGRIIMYCFGLFVDGAIFAHAVTEWVNRTGSLALYSFLLIAPLLTVITGSIIYNSVKAIINSEQSR